jgi:sulfite dehydrogenase (cytochrome) subunit B
VKHALALALTLTLACSNEKRLGPANVPGKPTDLPPLGTKSELLYGPGSEVAEAACLACHSADIIRQQTLTEKQWTATVEKMQKWGAPVRIDQKPIVIAYLARFYGPNNRWKPTEVRPIAP